MELNNKEKKIKQVLSELNYEVDTDFLWNEVSQELDKEKKKRRFFWIFPLLGIGMIAFLFINNYHFPENITQETNTLISDISNEHVVNEMLDQDTGKTMSENKIVKEQTKRNSQSTITKNRTKVTQKRNSQSLATSNSTTNNLTQNASSNPSKNKIDSKTNDLVKTEKVLNNAFNQEIKNGNNRPNNNTKNLSVFGNKNNLVSFLSINKLGLNTFTINEREKASLSLKTSQWIKVEPATNRYYISIGAGIIKDISSVTTNTDQVPSNLFNRETALWGTNMNIQLGKELKNKIKIFGGFDYAQLVTQYQNNEVEDFVADQAAELEFINASNSYTTTEGTLTSSTSIENDILWHKHHNMLNFQLGISKDLLPKNRFIIAPALSLLQNIYSSHKGYYFNEQAPSFVKFERGEENPYRKNTGLKTQLGLNLGYETAQYQFTINTSWRNPLTAITKGTNIYQIKNSQLSIQARINYLLNWEKN